MCIEKCIESFFSFNFACKCTLLSFFIYLCPSHLLKSSWAYLLAARYGLSNAANSKVISHLANIGLASLLTGAEETAPGFRFFWVRVVWGRGGAPQGCSHPEPRIWEQCRRRGWSPTGCPCPPQHVEPRARGRARHCTLPQRDARLRGK